MKHFLYSAAVLAATLLPASAATYECKVAKNDPSGWIPSIVIINHNTSSGAVSVNDPIIKHFIGKPVKGRVGTDNGKRTTFKWKIDGTTNSSAQFTTMEYSGTFQKKSKKFIITGKPLGYTNNYRGTGACKVK